MCAKHYCLLISGNSASGSDILLLTPPSSNVSLIEYRLLGGTLDFYFFSGPSPQKVVEQYGELVGLPTWQPAFGFGFHLCRWGYLNLNDTKDQVVKMREANIPLEGVSKLKAGLRSILMFLVSDVERYRSLSCFPRLYLRSGFLPCCGDEDVHRRTGMPSGSSDPPGIDLFASTQTTSITFQLSMLRLPIKSTLLILYVNISSFTQLE